MLIVFEGLDKTGKTTQSQLLFRYFTENGKPAILIRFPDRSTEIGNLIDKFLKKEINLSAECAHLLFSANRLEKLELIQNALAEGIIVICDRYYYSGIAYSLARGLDYDWCAAPDAKMPHPDRVIYFPERICAISGEEIYETENFQNKVANNFKSLIDNTWLIISKDTITNIKEKIIAFCV